MIRFQVRVDRKLEGGGHWVTWVDADPPAEVRKDSEQAGDGNTQGNLIVGKEEWRWVYYPPILEEIDTNLPFPCPCCGLRGGQAAGGYHYGDCNLKADGNWD